jgi:hypothetical protein
VRYLKYILVIAAILFFQGRSFSQLNCQVRIEAPQLPGTSEKQQLLDQMQKAIFEFMNNNNTWTKDLYTSQEKIDCSIFIDIISKVGADEYMASIQVQSRRPVFKSSYNSTMFNYIDDNFQFKFQQFTALEFNINNFQNNLTSVLAYYAYVVIAEDYDSFSPLGGTEYWQKAQLIVNNAQTASEKGWKSFEGNKNRYWLVENQLQPLFAGIRNCIYKYHRTGLDLMSEKVEEGRANLLKSLELLVPVYQSRPASFNMELFFNAKINELVDIFSGALPEEKSRALEILLMVDPANTNKYLKIQSN